MDQYNQAQRHNMTPVPSTVTHSDTSHLYTLVYRLMETVDRQARHISRLESSISEISSTVRNRSQ